MNQINSKKYSCFEFRRTLIKTTLLLVLSLLSIVGFGVVKEIGVPTIQNFQHSGYHAGTQNWSVVQGSNGVMYFGNNEGLLRYDGQFWSLFHVPNGSNVRSLLFSKTSQTLFAGAYNEFGYFSNDSLGMLTFTSRVSLIPEK